VVRKPWPRIRMPPIPFPQTSSRREGGKVVLGLIRFG
jgi:hypothetical protein